MFTRFSTALSVPKIANCFASEIKSHIQTFVVTCPKYAAKMQKQLFNALPGNLNYNYFSYTIGIFFAKSKPKQKKCLKLELFCINVQLQTLY